MFILDELLDLCCFTTTTTNTTNTLSLSPFSFSAALSQTLAVGSHNKQHGFETMAMTVNDSQNQ